MLKILILALREFKTSVRTRSFIIGLVIAPIFMGGGLIAFAWMNNRVDDSEKTICVIDYTGQIADGIVQMATNHNKNEIFDTVTGKQVKPSYKIVVVEPDTENVFKQKLELSDKVRNKEIHAFVEIGPDIIHPKNDIDKTKVKYYSESSLMDEVRGWLIWPINNRLRELRIADAGIPTEQLTDLFNWTEVSGMGLIEDKGQGADTVEKETGEIETILIPYVLLMLMFMIVMLSAIPLLNSVLEEKTERIAEVLLGSVTPFQFMMGKVLGSVSVSITGMFIYVAGGAVIASELGYTHYVPFDLIPWFITFTLLNVLMIGSIMAALGSACNDSKDAQSLQFPAMIPIILPMFVIMPILKEPLGSFATTFSLIPPFTPLSMIVRQASPVSIPLWQPIAGLIGVILFTVFVIWVGSKVFRTLILIQGKRPSFVTMIKYAFKK